MVMMNAVVIIKSTAYSHYLLYYRVSGMNNRMQHTQCNCIRANYFFTFIDCTVLPLYRQNTLSAVQCAAIVSKLLISNMWDKVEKDTIQLQISQHRKAKIYLWEIISILVIYIEMIVHVPRSWAVSTRIGAIPINSLRYSRFLKTIAYLPAHHLHLKQPTNTLFCYHQSFSYGTNIQTGIIQLNYLKAHK